MGNIIYLERDELTAQLYYKVLSRLGNVINLLSEHDFMLLIDIILREAKMPELLVLEQRVQWSDDLEIDSPPPPDWYTLRSGGAGIRCYVHLIEIVNELEMPELPPVVFFTDEVARMKGTLWRRGYDQSSYNWSVAHKDSSSLRTAITRALSKK